LQYIPRLARIKSPGSKIPRLIKCPLLPFQQWITDEIQCLGRGT
jgi:hypothetical protein